MGKLAMPPKACCKDCKLPYRKFPLDVILPRSQWLAIMGSECGLLCASCIVKRIARRIPRATVCHLIVEVAPMFPTRPRRKAKAKRR